MIILGTIVQVLGRMILMFDFPNNDLETKNQL